MKKQHKKLNCFDCLNYISESCTGKQNEHPCLCLNGNNLNIINKKLL